MKLDRVKNTKRNIVYGFLNKIVVLFLPFLIRTILVYTMGIEYAGLNGVFTSILQILNLTELGFGSAAVYSMYKPIAENDRVTICNLLNFYRKIYFGIGCIVFLIGILCVPFLPIIIHPDSLSHVNIYSLYFIFLFNSCISYFFYGYKNILLYAHQRVDVLSNIMTVAQGSMFLFQMIVLLVFKNYYFYTLLMPIFTILNNGLVSHVADKLYPEYVCKGKISDTVMKSIKKQVSGLMIHKLCITTRSTFDSVFISAVSGLTISAIYGNYYIIINAVVDLISVLTNSILAGVGNSIQLEDREKNYRDFKKFNFLYMWICGWAAICLLCLYQPFMTLWMGKDNLFHFDVILLFCGYFYMLKVGDMKSLYSDAVGLWWENRHLAIVESLLNLALNYFLGKKFGVHGIVIATLLSLFFINFLMSSQIVFKYYFRNDKIGEYFFSHAKYFCVTLIISLPTYFLCSLLPDNSYIGFLLKGIICVLFPNIGYFTLYKGDPLFQEMMEIISKKIL